MRLFSPRRNWSLSSFAFRYFVIFLSLCILIVIALGFLSLQQFDLYLYLNYRVRVRGSSPVMEALRSTHWNGIGVFVVRLRWVCECVWKHNWHNSLAGSSSLMNIMCYIASSVFFRIFSLFYFLLFIMNGSWLDVLDLLCSAHPCHHVGSSNLADNPSITLLTMRYVLILNRGDWSFFVYELCFCVDNNWRLEKPLLSCHHLIVAAWFWWPSNGLEAIDLSCHQLIGAVLFWWPSI